MYRSLIYKLSLLTLMVCAMPALARAQTLESTITPITPAPGELVSITIKDFSLNLNTAEISWYQDTKLIKKGKGIKTFSFTVGANATVVRVAVDDAGRKAEKTFTIYPARVDMLWETIGGYEPPFYRGKIMPTKSSFVKVVAVPQVRNGTSPMPSPKTFVYSWKKDGSNVASQSGYGKDSMTFTPSILDRTTSIDVTANGATREIHQATTVAYGTPEIHFYEYSNLYGPLYHKALRQGQVVPGSVINIVAEPFFFPADDLTNPSMVSEWKVNKLVVAPSKKNVALLSVAENVKTVVIEFSADLKNQLLQKVSRPITINVSHGN